MSTTKIFWRKRLSPVRSRRWDARSVRRFTCNFKVSAISAGRARRALAASDTACVISRVSVHISQTRKAIDSKLGRYLQNVLKNIFYKFYAHNLQLTPQNSDWSSFLNFACSGHVSWALGLFMAHKCIFTRQKLSFMVPVARFCSFSMRKKILKNVKKNYVKKIFFSWPND